jgi:hypothetical protein
MSGPRAGDYNQVVGKVLDSYASWRERAEIREAKRMLHSTLRGSVLPDLYRELGISGRDFKLDTRVVVHRGSGRVFIPLNALFFPYTMDAESRDVEIRDFKIGQNMTVIELETAYGNFYFTVNCLGNVAGGLSLSPRQTYADGQPRFTLISQNPNARQIKFIAITRVDPYVCTNCNRTHVPKMQKCQGCWDNLRICVRYCSKECQRADYVERHRYICGCKANTSEKLSRDNEYASRSQQARDITLLSLSESERDNGP